MSFLSTIKPTAELNKGLYWLLIPRGLFRPNLLVNYFAGWLFQQKEKNAFVLPEEIMNYYLLINFQTNTR
jgi:hypothetical protein